MGCDVYHDHGPADERGEIVSWFGDDYGRGARLSQLDIAIVDHADREVVALIEIEETNDKPKTFLGDVLATLMGDRIFYQREPLKVNKCTTLIVVGKGSPSHQKRNDHLKLHIEECRSALTTANASIGSIEIRSIANADDFQTELTKLIKAALERHSVSN